ncbi:MAG TPA: large conductance mechanosensitive channel protein MscL [Vicinamibacterales bacterium]|nr:large conductance mechanosensitive channel protein MscL [Vicinamibacterales bacterium]
MLKEFRDFIARGNVIELAVALVMGAAFGKIIGSLVEGVIMPPLGLLIGGIDFASLFYLLDASKGVPASLLDAKARGIPVIAYGQVINDIVTFVLVAFVIFLIVRSYNRMKNEPSADGPTTKDCPLCLSTIPLSATRCAHCTSALP